MVGSGTAPTLISIELFGTVRVNVSLVVAPVQFAVKVAVNVAEGIADADTILWEPVIEPLSAEVIGALKLLSPGPAIITGGNVPGGKRPDSGKIISEVIDQVIEPNELI